MRQTRLISKQKVAQLVHDLRLQGVVHEDVRAPNTMPG
jgi:hypothetical protein